jgi:hypothetical protein
MLRIDRNKQSFSLLATPTLADVSIMERYDLQEFISNSPKEFFQEIGQELFLLGKEVEPSKNVQDRLDLLAVDKEGTIVIIELKRGTHKLHLFQAISYAGMISQWRLEDFVQSLTEEQQDDLSNFLEVDLEDINRQQRIILIAEAYDYALLVGAEWLTEHFGVDITCCRIAVAKDASTNSEYLVCSIVYPAPELVQEAVPRGRKRPGTSKGIWPDWDAALASVTNTAVSSHFKQELATKRESYLRKRILQYRIAGKRRWFLAARQKNAYVWQHGRFDGDVEFWRGKLSKPDEIKPVKNGSCLRLFLYTDDDFRSFHIAATKELNSTEWLGGTPEEDLEEVEAVTDEA